jgi:hypothetical protein
VGAGVCARIEQALPPTFEADEQSYRTDETYIKVRGEDKYLYRAVDSTGQAIEFLLTAKRDRCGSQALLPLGFERSRQSRPSGDQRGQEPGLSGGGGSIESGRLSAAPS